MGQTLTNINFGINHYLNGLPSSTKKRLLQNILETFEANNTVANILNSFDYKKIIESIRTTTPDIFSGEISCVDGRLPSLITHLPKITRTWKEPGAVAISSNFSDQLPARLAIAVENHFLKYPEKQLIEFVQAHTSLTHQTNHGCGAIKLALHGNGPDFETDGGLAWNISQLQDTSVNALMHHANKNKHLLTTISEVLDTDTGAIYYGLDKYASSPISKNRITDLSHQEKIISTINVFNTFRKQIEKLNTMIPAKRFIEYLYLPKKALFVYKSIYELTSKIAKEKEITTYLNALLNELFGKNSKEVREFIRYRILHNISFGYLTGFFIDSNTNPFNHHHEKYISIGEVGIGDEVVSSQGFRVTHISHKQCVEDLIIMLDLMEKNKEVEKPYTVFLVKPINNKLYLEDPYQQTLQRARTDVLSLRRVIYNHPILARRLINRQFILLPCLVEEKNQEVIEIPIF